MTRDELITLRMNMLGGMDAYIREHIGDEDILVDWLMNGVPDEGTEEDLYTIAEDETLWLTAVKSFARCCGYEQEDC